MENKRTKNGLFFAAAIWVLEDEFSVGKVSVLRGRRKGDPSTKYDGNKEMIEFGYCFLFSFVLFLMFFHS